MKKTVWSCESCGQQGSFFHGAHLDVWGALSLLGDSHRKVSPDCAGDLSTIRLLRIEDVWELPQTEGAAHA